MKKDTATHFFINYLPKGTYVFEYDLRVQHRGAYQNGMAHIECMSAPEFNSHSESVKREVRQTEGRPPADLFCGLDTNPRPGISFFRYRGSRLRA